MSQKLEITKRLIGKTVTVVEDAETWIGEVIDVKDENTVIVRESGLLHSVDIFDIRDTR